MEALSGCALRCVVQAARGAPPISMWDSAYERAAFPGLFAGAVRGGWCNLCADVGPDGAVPPGTVCVSARSTAAVDGTFVAGVAFAEDGDDDVDDCNLENAEVGEHEDDNGGDDLGDDSASEVVEREEEEEEEEGGRGRGAAIVGTHRGGRPSAAGQLWVKTCSTTRAAFTSPKQFAGRILYQRGVEMAYVGKVGLLYAAAQNARTERLQERARGYLPPRKAARRVDAGAAQEARAVGVLLPTAYGRNWAGDARRAVALVSKCAAKSERMYRVTLTLQVAWFPARGAAGVHPLLAYVRQHGVQDAGAAAHRLFAVYLAHLAELCRDGGVWGSCVKSLCVVRTVTFPGGVPRADIVVGRPAVSGDDDLAARRLEMWFPGGATLEQTVDAGVASAWLDAMFGACKAQDEALGSGSGATDAASHALATWRTLRKHTFDLWPSTFWARSSLEGEDKVVFECTGDPAAAAEAQPLDWVAAYFEREGAAEAETFEEWCSKYALRKGVLHRRRVAAVASCPPLHPRAGEGFYFRELLLRAPARSFEEVRTVRGKTYGTFAEAASAAGCVPTDVWQPFLRAMAEAKERGGASPEQLRQLFVMLAWECGHAVSVFHLVRSWLVGDEDDSTLLVDLHRRFIASGRNGAALLGPLLGPPLASASSCVDGAVSAEAADAKFASCSLADEQLPIFAEVKAAVMTSTPLAMYITGRAGTGKSTVLATIVASVASDPERSVVVVAATGAVALRHAGGQTAHRCFGLDVAEDLRVLAEHPACLDAASANAQRLRDALLIVIDELPMLHQTHVAGIDRLLRHLTGNEAVPFGGKVVVACGDIAQTLPVVRGACGRYAAVRASVVSNRALWGMFTVRELKVCRRMPGEAEYAQWLQDCVAYVHGDVELHAAIQRPADTHALRAFVHPAEELRKPNHAVHAAKRALLVPTRVLAEAHNAAFLAQLAGEEVVYRPEIGRLGDEVDTSGHSLRLKPGCLAMVTRNLDTGVVNGTRVEVLSCLEHVVQVRQLEGPGEGSIAFLPRFLVQVSVPDRALPVVHRQFPLQLAYSVTINKSQGWNLERAGVDLSHRPVFSHGQLYVALSRTPAPCKVAVLTREWTGSVRNVVAPVMAVKVEAEVAPVKVEAEVAPVKVEAEVAPVKVEAEVTP